NPNAAFPSGVRKVAASASRNCFFDASRIPSKSITLESETLKETRFPMGTFVACSVSGAGVEAGGVAELDSSFGIDGADVFFSRGSRFVASSFAIASFHLFLIGFALLRYKISSNSGRYCPRRLPVNQRQNFLDARKTNWYKVGGGCTFTMFQKHIHE